MTEDHQISPQGTRHPASRRRRNMMGGHPDDLLPRGYRFPAALPAELHDSGRTFPCGVQNLSRTGVLLVGLLPTPSAERVDLTLKAATGRHQVRLSARVIRVDPDEGSGGVCMALDFVDLDDSGRDAIEILLARVMQGQTTSGPFDSLKPGVPPHEVRRVLEAIPLAQRISLGARAGQKDREYLRQDSNPAVLDALIRNPGLVVAEARAIAASQFLAAPTIDILAGESRFNRDEELRIALASHPQATMHAAERITSDFNPAQIRKLLAKPGLNPAMRDKLMKRLMRG